MSKQVKYGLIAALVFQFFVLTGMYVKAAIPLWIGQEIRVKTVPVDPRSLFRGNYARLQYDFSRIDGSYFNGEERLRNGDVVYITLQQDKAGLYNFANAGLESPTGSVFLRGRVSGANFSKQKLESYDINYGIDAFFAPKKEALALEKELRDGGIAILMVDKDGSARVKDVVGE